MGKIKTVFGQVCILLGCVIGSGFVGGKELLLTFGTGSILSVALFVLVLCLLIFVLINFCIDKKIYTFENFNNLVFGKLNICCHFSMLFCYFVVTATLLATTNVCMIQVFKLDTNAPIFSFLAGIVAWLVMLKGFDAIKKFNAIALPFILIYLAVVHFAHFEKMTIVIFPVEIVPSFSYAFFNVVATLPILTVSCKKIEKKSAVAVVLTMGVILFFWSTFQIGLLNKPEYNNLGIPLFAIVQSNTFLYWTGCIAVVFACVTAILSNCLPLIEHVNGLVKDFSLSCSIVFFLALLLSLFGMDFLIKYVYPFISLFGVAVIVALSISALKKPLHLATA